MSTSSPTLGTPLRRVVAVPLPTLRLLPAPARHASRGTFVTFLLLLLGAGMAAVLVLTTVLQQRAFQLYELEQQLTDAQQRRSILVADLAGAESPEQLQRAARALGMVPAGGSLFLDVRSGTTAGEPVPAAPAPAPPARGGAR
jgi:hypothetical protein